MIRKSWTNAARTRRWTLQTTMDPTPADPVRRNYLPGVEPVFVSEDIGGYQLKKTILLLDNIHYGPSPVDTTSVTSTCSSPRGLRSANRDFITGHQRNIPIIPPLVMFHLIRFTRHDAVYAT